MVVKACTWVLVSALVSILLCLQVSHSEARSFQPPHTVFGARSVGDEGFDREVRKVPPFALFGGRQHERALGDEMWREERKVPPFAVFGQRPHGYEFERDARVAPPFTLFGNKDRAEHGKRTQDDFPMA